MKLLKSTGVEASEMQIDPLLFAISTLFVLGVGLLFLRIYPYLLRLIYTIGKKFWPPALYVSLLQVARSKGQEQFLMLFIILAISIGLFNANSARTINKNVEDKVRYSIGADVTLLAKWEDNQPDNTGMPMGVMGGGMGSDTAAAKEPLRYFEPDYIKYSTLSGTDTATKVFKQKTATVNSSQEAAGGISVMGIIPNEFAKIAWFRADLLPHHWYEYVNLLADAPRAMILSSNLKETLKVKEGDTIYVSWGDQNYLEGMVYAFVDYWPTLSIDAKDSKDKNSGFVVMNFSYIQNKLAIQPYQVWIKKKSDTPDKQIHDDILVKELDISEISYTNQELIKKKNDPLLQGTNGALTLGFVAAMLISMLGFLIYWIMSIQSRVLQFGIYRAMGLSLAGVIAIIAFEQLLVSGAAIIAGIAIGGLAGDFFIPFFQMLYSAADQVPPFKIVAFREDYIKIYIVLAIMLTGGFAILWRIIAAIRIDQALKLGED
jgi:putative ABC transport system permease protein